MSVERILLRDYGRARERDWERLGERDRRHNSVCANACAKDSEPLPIRLWNFPIHVIHTHRLVKTKPLKKSLTIDVLGVDSSTTPKQTTEMEICWQIDNDLTLFTS